MAIAKTIQIHQSSGVQNVERYIENPEKSALAEDSDDLNRVLQYDMNGKKTMDQKAGKTLVSGYRCNPGNAAAEFEGAKALYQSLHKAKKLPDSKKEVCAIHLVMSFPEVEDLDPTLVHQIGMEFVSSLKDRGIGDYQAVVSTHLNTAHLHNHILLNAYSVDGKRKFADNKATLRILREINDDLSRKYGLPILDQEQNRKVHSLKREMTGEPVPDNGTFPEPKANGNFFRSGVFQSESMNERQARLHGRSWKEQIRQDIDAVIELSSSCEDWKAQMRDLGYEIRELNSGIPISVGFGSHHIRLSKLGPDYRGEALIQRIARATGLSEDLVMPKPPKTPQIYFERISRYDENGHKRSTLALLFLHLISYIKNMIRYMIALNRSYELQDFETRLAKLEKAMELLDRYGIANRTELRSLKKNTGYRIKSLQNQAAFYSSAKEKIQKCLETGDLPDDAKAFYPATPIQRRDLYRLLKDKNITVHINFDDLTALGADQLLSYLQDPDHEKNVSLSDFFIGITSLSSPVTRDTLQELLDHADKEEKQTIAALEQENKKYKDLIFLQDIVRYSEDFYEELREQKEQERQQGDPHRSGSAGRSERNSYVPSSIISAWCRIPGASFDGKRFMISKASLSDDIYQICTQIAEKLNKFSAGDQFQNEELSLEDELEHVLRELENKPSVEQLER